MSEPKVTDVPRRPPGSPEEPRLRAIIDHVADGIVIVAADGTVRFANPSAERLFGRAASELLGEPFGFPLANDATEIDVVRRGGVPAVAELRVAEMEWDGEDALLVSLRDVTDRREAEQRRQELVRAQAARERAEAEERRFRFLAEAGAVLDSSLDYPRVLARLARLIVSPGEEPAADDAPPASARLADWCVIDVVDADHRIRRVAAAHHDAALEPALDRLRERFPPDWGRPSPAMEALRTRRPLLLPRTEPQIAALTRDEEHARLLWELGFASVMAVPIQARGDTIGAVTLVRQERCFTEEDLALAYDLAQRSGLSIANARLYHDAQEANRAKANFLATMSHELRTPLNAIMGYTDLLEAGISGPVNERQCGQLQRISAASQHLLQIVEEILTFARVEAGREELHLSRVELNGLIAEVADMVRPLAARKGLDFDVRTPTEPVRVDTDPGKARQIVLNLLSNAVKFTDQGSVTVRLSPDGTGHRIRVADTGLGITPENLKRIWDPFWQVEQSTSRTAGGTGLGLSVARRLSGLLGGRLSAESTPGEGTAFTLWLPAAAPTPQPDPEE